jgi:hypothetical protein
VSAPRFRPSLGIVLAFGLLATSFTPVSAGAPAITVVVDTPQPATVTQGRPVAYPVTVTNNGTSTVNHATLSGSTSVPATFITSYPVGACSTAAVCDIGTLAGGGSYSVILVYQAPTTVGTFNFTATFTGGEGGNDNEGPASHQDTFRSSVPTHVVAFSTDSVHQYALAGGAEVSTGIENGVVTTGNPHGTSVVVPVTEQGVETKIEDVTDSSCPAELANQCFGQASLLEIGQGRLFTSPLKVQIRFDYSELPSGMTDKKLRVVHFYADADGAHADPITTVCNAGATNAPCYVPAVKQVDKDLVITVYLLHNGNIRGW